MEEQRLEEQRRARPNRQGGITPTLIIIHRLEHAGGLWRGGRGERPRLQVDEVGKAASH